MQAASCCASRSRTPAGRHGGRGFVCGNAQRWCVMFVHIIHSAQFQEGGTRRSRSFHCVRHPALCFHSSPSKATMSACAPLSLPSTTMPHLERECADGTISRLTSSVAGSGFPLSHSCCQPHAPDSSHPPNPFLHKQCPSTNPPSSFARMCALPD